MDDLELGPAFLESPFDERGELVTDPAASRLHQARVFARLDPEATDLLVRQLYASAPPESGRPARRTSPSWIALRAQLVREQGLMENPVLD